MGYYENPPIITPKSDNMAAYITDAGNSIAQALIRRGDKKREEEKERKLTLQKLQERKNKLDIAYSDKYSNWRSNQTDIQGDADLQIQGLIQESITKAADDTLLLEQEVDPIKRAEYLKSRTDADLLLDNSGKFAKSLAGQVATYRLKTPAIKLGEIGGSVVNGKNDEEILNNTAALEVLGGNSTFVKDSKIDVKKNKDNNGIILTVSGHHKDTNTPFQVEIDSNTFNKSDEESDNGLLIPVESNDAFVKDAKKTFFSDDGKDILPGFLEPTLETYDLDSKNTSSGKGDTNKDVYQITNGKRLQYNTIKAGVDSKAEISATGILSAYSSKPAKLRAFIDYTLKKGVNTYDDNFISKPADEQKQLLKQWMSDSAMESMTKELEKTTTKDGTIYWAPSSDIRKKDKTSEKTSAKAVSPDQENKDAYTSVSEKEYNDIIKDWNPKDKNKSLKNLAVKANNLSANSGKYISREELYQKYQNEAYVQGKYDTGLTVKQAYEKGKLKGDISSAFRSEYGASQMYSQKGDGVYVPVEGYDFNKASDRVRFALQNTANMSEQKAMSRKVIEAERFDWISNNPKKPGETDKQYSERVKNAIK